MDIKRLPKAVIDNLVLFDQAYPTDALLVKHVLFALSYDIQEPQFPETLWGYKQIDPYKLVKLLGFASVKVMVNPSQRPAQFEGMSPEEICDAKRAIIAAGDTLWSSNLDNAIWILRTKKKYSTVGWKVSDVRKKSFSRIIEDGFVDDAKKYTVAGNRKTLYEVKTSPSFKAKIAANFSRYDHDILISLPLAVRNLYLSLILQRERGKYPVSLGEEDKNMVTVSPYFDHMVYWVNAQSVPDDQQREKKARINKAVKKLNAVIEDQHGFRFADLTWDYYTPTLNLYYRPEEFEQRKEEREDRFKVFLLDNLKEKYRKLHPATEIDTLEGYNYKMREWILNSDKDFAKKQDVINLTLRQVFPGFDHKPNFIMEVTRKSVRDYIPSFATQISNVPRLIDYGFED